jgi:hypothetical protein
VVAEQDFQHDDAEYDDEPPRRSRGLLIVGALVGAIGLGGGLAYAYKTFLGPTPGGKPPVVKADKSPAKTAPADPGGKQIANQGIKVMNGRLTEGGNAPNGSLGQSASTAASEDGVRRVSTLAVRPDGSMAPPMPQPPPAVGPPPATPVGVPGMQVVDPLRRAPPAGMPGMMTVNPPAPPQQAAVPPPASPARTITLPPPRAELPPAAPPTKVAVAAPPPAPQPKAPAPRANVMTPAEPDSNSAAPPAAKRPVARPAGVGGSGFVAVLASQRSSMEALKLFADLQQKYSVLQGRTPSVQEANLGEKGVYHRLVVGPAGPREQASQLCSELKAAGYSGCWITAQ